MKAPLRCRCGLEYPPEDFINGLCPECRLARILTEHDRPAPDRVEMELRRGNHE
jgi:NMD protein affecting ribosome stability and mRNA decay